MEKVIDKVSYRIGKLNAFEQLHISRRIAPILTALGSGIKAAPSSINQEDLIDMIVAGVLTPAAVSLAAMPDEEVNYVLFGCLRKVQRREGDAWAELCAPTGGNALMYDIDLPTMLKLVASVLGVNLGNFLPVSPSTSASAGEA